MRPRKNPVVALYAINSQFDLKIQIFFWIMLLKRLICYKFALWAKIPRRKRSRHRPDFTNIFLTGLPLGRVSQCKRPTKQSCYFDAISNKAASRLIAITCTYSRVSAFQLMQWCAVVCFFVIRQWWTRAARLVLSHTAPAFGQYLAAAIYCTIMFIFIPCLVFHDIGSF